MKVVFSLTLQLTLVIGVYGEIFTSMAKLEPLIATEDQLLVNIQEYLNNERQRLDSLERLVQQIQQERVDPISGNASINLGHPIQSHLLIRRLRQQWLRVNAYVNDTEHRNNYSEKFQQFENSSSQYPTNEDYLGSIRALLRLQDTYELQTSSMANGSILGVRSSPPLLPRDCYDLGDSAWLESDVNRVLEWMQEALKRENQSEEKKDYHVISILHQISDAFYKKENLTETLKHIYQILELDPEDRLAKEKQIYYEKILKIKETGNDYDVTEEEEERYKALCRGDKTAYKKPTNPDELICRYNHYNRPRLFIRPAKEEILFTEPRIVFYHDIITDMEIEHLKQRALPHMKRAKVGLRSEDGGQESKIRISNIAWLRIFDSDDPLAKILPRVQDYTGLSTKENHTEPMQVVNYGLGGFYISHYDDESEGVVDGLRGMGKRIATVLFYFSDVEAGGATVFTKAGVRVPPVKGSAVVWYTYLKNGDWDIQTRHAGCPVLMGTKWASNLWIREFGQVFRRKCGLTQDDKY